MKIIDILQNEKEKIEMHCSKSIILGVLQKSLTSPVRLDDEEGICIFSDKDVIIEAKEKMSLVSLTESLSVEAKESIAMIQGDTRITVKEDVLVEGAQAKVQ